MYYTNSNNHYINLTNWETNYYINSNNNYINLTTWENMYYINFNNHYITNPMSYVEKVAWDSDNYVEWLIFYLFISRAALTNLKQFIWFASALNFFEKGKKMRKHRFKTIRLFLKLMLLFKIYFYHCSKAEASENYFPVSLNEGNFGEKSDFNHQIPHKDTGFSVAEQSKRPARLLPWKKIL